MAKAKMSEQAEARMWSLWKDDTFRRPGRLTTSERREYNRLCKQYKAVQKGQREDHEKVRI